MYRVNPKLEKLDCLHRSEGGLGEVEYKPKSLKARKGKWICLEREDIIQKTPWSRAEAERETSELSHLTLPEETQKEHAEGVDEDREVRVFVVQVS